MEKESEQRKEKECNDDEKGIESYTSTHKVFRVSRFPFPSLSHHHHHHYNRYRPLYPQQRPVLFAQLGTQAARGQGGGDQEAGIYLFIYLFIDSSFN